MLKKVLATAASAALVATPVMAQTAPIDRAPASVEDMEELESGPGIIIAILAAAAIIAGIIVAASDEEDDVLPTSP